MIRLPIRAILLLSMALMAAMAVPARAADDPRYLARAGDCTSCHTAPGGKPFAGGLRVATPLGAIYTTNITPDRATGIGRYSFADFDRALRRGIARDGHRLYPAMPYPSYAKLSDADMRGLYDYFMNQVSPVRQPNRAGEIAWPLDMRWPLAVWDALFLDGARFRPRPDRDAAWNRGAYLVEGLGHCGACHTPRGIAWNEEALDDRGAAYLAGATLDFWSAPDLRGDARTGLGAWPAAAIVAFLKTGHNRHGTVFGAMNLVTGNSTPYLDDADRAAIATYLKSLPPRRQAASSPYAEAAATRSLHDGGLPGALLYRGECARCHGDNGAGQAPQVPPLAGNPIVLDRDPTSLIHVALDGAVAPASQPRTDDSRMPPFRRVLSDTQIASVITFIRQSWGNRAGWVPTEAVAAVRSGTRPTADQVARGAALVASEGCGSCHAIPGIAGAAGRVGPPLDNIGDRTIIAGLLANSPANLADWLQSPQRIKPGDAMPDVGLSRRQALDIAAFLGTLRDRPE
jgi:mono/diheme cytochrome c family protein